MIPVSLAVLLGMSVYIVPEEIRRHGNKNVDFFFLLSIHAGEFYEILTIC